eukprot:519431-Prymnesium_polylepis.1
MVMPKGSIYRTLAAHRKRSTARRNRTSRTIQRASASAGRGAGRTVGTWPPDRQFKSENML